MCPIKRELFGSLTVHWMHLAVPSFVIIWYTVQHVARVLRTSLRETAGATAASYPRHERPRMSLRLLSFQIPTIVMLRYNSIYGLVLPVSCVVPCTRMKETQGKRDLRIPTSIKGIRAMDETNCTVGQRTRTSELKNQFLYRLKSPLSHLLPPAESCPQWAKQVHRTAPRRRATWKHKDARFLCSKHPMPVYFPPPV